MRDFFLRRAVLLALILALSIACQGQLRELLGISAGLNVSRLFDEKLSPLVYSGSTMAGEVFFLQENAKRQHHLAIDYTQGTLESEISHSWRQGDHSLLLRLGKIEHHMSWPVRLRLPSGMRFHLGYQWHLTGNHRQLKYVGNITEVNFEAITGIGPSALLSYAPAGRHAFSWNLALPLLSFVGRRGYSPRRFVNEEFFAVDNLEWIGSFPDLQSRLGYQFHWTHRWTIIASYFFRYYQYRSFVPFRFAHHRVALSIALNLSKK